MQGLPKGIYGKWGHSYEEDNDDTLVFRPEHFDFPPARGRDGIEFRPDGSFIEWAVGADDSQQGVCGKCQSNDMRTIHVTFDQSQKMPREFEIVHCDSQILKLRQKE